MRPHYRQAITCKFIPATNTKPARVKASCAAGSITISYHDQDGCPFFEAARQLCNKLEWSGEIAGGVIKTGEHVFVICDDEWPILILGNSE